MRLNKALYGLKRVARRWNQVLVKILSSGDYKWSKFEPGVFYKVNNKGTITIIVTWVDDILITGNNDQEIEKCLKIISSHVEYQDGGEVHWYIGIEIT